MEGVQAREPGCAAVVTARLISVMESDTTKSPSPGASATESGTTKYGLEAGAGAKRAAPIDAETSAFDKLTAGSKKCNGGTKKAKALEKEAEKKAKLEAGNAAIELVLEAKGARPASDFKVCVISKGRPGNVMPLMKLFEGTDANLIWVVGVGETEAYTAAGAHACVEGGGLCASRNAAIELCAKSGSVCVEMSDDLTKVSILEESGPYTKPKDLSAATAMSKSECVTHLVSPLNAARLIEAEMRAR